MEQTAHDMLKKYPCYNEMSMGEQLAMKQASMEIAIAYHTSECKEAGMRTEMENDDLATDISVMRGAPERKQSIMAVVEVYCALLEDQKSQLEEKNKEIERLTGRTQDMAKELNQHSENYAKAVSQLEAQDKQIEGWKNLHKEDTTILQKQLQEAKVEVKEFREVLRELVVLKEMKDKDKGLKSEEYVTRKPLAWEKARELLSKSQLSTKQTTDKG